MNAITGILYFLLGILEGSVSIFEAEQHRLTVNRERGVIKGRCCSFITDAIKRRDEYEKAHGTRKYEKFR